MRRLLFVATLAAAVATPLRGQELTPVEADLAAWADANAEEAVALLQRIVDINSGSLNLEGVREVGRVLRAELDALGLETEWVDVPETGRAGHLLARTNGGEGKRILMIGHLDTVFEEDDPFQSFQRDGNRATGPGIDDMKAGDVVMIFALRALAEAGLLDDVQITAVFTGDEESPGEPLELARRDLIEAGKWADIALGFESGIRDEEAEWATVARRSASEWRLSVTGRQAHSSGIFSEEAGAGAIFEAARILNGFYEEVRGEEYLTFNAGVILGGTDVGYDYEETRGTAFGKTNVIPNTVVVHGGIRTISNEQLERARQGMRDVVARHLPRTSAEVTFTEGYPSMPPTPGNIALQEALSAINVGLGRDPMPALDPARRGAADISFVAPYVDGLAGLGGYGEGAHAPGESLDLESLPLAIKRAAILIYRLTRESPVL
ncbi:MAG: M20/M25/M40 family metallo-hydrolase [Gemmatimonadota bacterium]|nr:M20/M25/M40 family metallo-hydrolase [Gemmatimonadota bacterium]MDH5759400.1 M20/M25/M40 family metallo-hydrolase [Gemmatimonadota bacterium]